MQPRKDFSYTTWIIDVEKSVVPGRLCFCPVMPDEHDEEGVLSQITFYGEHPPMDGAEIVGLMVTHPDFDIDAWSAIQQPWLDKLNLRKTG